MANLIGAGMVSGSTPPPTEHYVQDDFEDGQLASEWTSQLNTEVDEFTILGVDGPVGGGAKGVRIPTNGNLQIVIPGMDIIWITCWSLTPAVGASPVYLCQLLDADSSLQRIRVYPNSVLQVENTADGNIYSSDRTFSPDTWYKFKFYVYQHKTLGIIQARYDDGSGWVLTIDEQNINTLRPNKLIANVRAMSSATRSQNFHDEFNVLKTDPGSGMRSN